jgi:hypothetical protein
MLGPLPHNPDPIETKAESTPPHTLLVLSARAKTIFTARIQTARINTGKKGNI